MKVRLFLSIFTLCIFILSSPAYSQIYQWKDEKGMTHFSDTPPVQKSFTKVKMRDAEPSRPASDDRGGSKGQAAKGKEKRPPGDIKVIMYMTDWCPYCVKAKNLLNSLGVNLAEYNVDKDREKREEAKRKSGGTGVPVLDIEGVIIKGYAPERIKAAVEKRRDS